MSQDSGGVFRAIEREGGETAVSAPELEAWLDYLEGKRDCLIMELRLTDRILVENGRLKRETLERRSRG